MFTWMNIITTATFMTWTSPTLPLRNTVAVVSGLRSFIVTLRMRGHMKSYGDRPD